MTPSETDALKVEAREKADKRGDNLQKIDDLFKDSGGFLTGWETKFLTSIEHFLKQRKDLTEKQQNCLDAIVKKAMERYD